MALPELRARVSADTGSFDTSMDSAAAKLGKFGAAANAANGSAAKLGNTLNSTGSNIGNITAQFQDIGVMMASGQSPLLLALQQGTQLSSVLNQMQNPLQGLIAGFTQLINPVSLITIGAIAFGAAAFQAIASLIPKTESATEALQRHRDAIAEATSGYSSANKSVQEFLDKLTALPQEAAIAEVAASFDALVKKTEEFRRKSEALGPTLAFAVNASDQELGRLLVKFNEGEISAGELSTALTELGNRDHGLTNLFGMFERLVNEMRDGAVAAIEMQDALIGVSFAAAEMQNTFTKDVLAPALNNAIKSQQDAIDKLKGLTPDLRTQQQIIVDTFNEALANPTLTEAMRAELTATKDAALAMQNKADAAKAAEAAVRSSATAQAEAERMQASFTQLQAQLEGPAALEELQYNNRLSLLDAYYAARGEKDAEYYRLAGLAKEQHEAALEKIDAAARAAEMQRQQMMVNNVTSILGSINQVMASQGDKQIATQKAISSAIVAINTAQGISKAIADYGWPGAILPSAAIAAQGIAQLAAINSASKSSASIAGPSGGATEPSSQMNRTLTVQGISPGQIFTGDTMREMMDQMLQMQRDGYQVVLQ